jgi:hypothetical protein
MERNPGSCLFGCGRTQKGSCAHGRTCGPIYRRKKDPMARGDFISISFHEYAKEGPSLAEQLSETYPLEPKWWKALAHIHLSEGSTPGGTGRNDHLRIFAAFHEKEKKLMAELSLMAGNSGQSGFLL